MFDSITGSGEGIGNSFLSSIGSVVEGIGNAAGSFAEKFLPVWAGNQLNLQKQDQFDNSVFQRGVSGSIPSGNTSRTLFDGNNLNFDSSTILIAGAALVTLVIILKVAK